MIWIGLALLALVGAGYLIDEYLLDRRADRQFRQRLNELGRATGVGGGEGDDTPETERLMGRLMMSSSGVTRRLMQANWVVTPPRMIAFVTLILLVAVAGIWLAGPIFGLIAVGAVVVLAFSILDNAAERQVGVFLEELPNFLERLRQLISTGNSQAQAFDKALVYSGDAARIYLDPVALRLKIGVPLPDALRVQAQRLAIAELAMLALVVRTNLRYGGNLGQILEHLTRVLRDRIRARSEFKALSSELRTTAMVMVAIPPLVAVAILLMNPGYLDYFAEKGQGMLITAVLLELAGILVMRRLMRVDY